MGIFSNLFNGTMGNSNPNQSSTPRQVAPGGGSPGFDPSGKPMEKHNLGGQQVTPGSTMVQNNPGADPTKQNQQQDSSPLDSFKDLWKDNPQSPGAAGNGNLFNMDPAKLEEAVSRSDFLSQLPKDKLATAMQGVQNPDALMEIMNGLAQRAFSMSLQMGTNMTEAAGKQLQTRFKDGFGDLYQQHSLKTMKPDNPILQDPAVAPMLDMVREKIRSQNPGMSPDDIQAQAMQYFDKFSSAFSANTPDAQKQREMQQRNPNEVDWEAELGLSPQRF